MDKLKMVRGHDTEDKNITFVKVNREENKRDVTYSVMDDFTCREMLNLFILNKEVNLAEGPPTYSCMLIDKDINRKEDITCEHCNGIRTFLRWPWLNRDEQELSYYCICSSPNMVTIKNIK